MWEARCCATAIGRLRVLLIELVHHHLLFSARLPRRELHYYRAFPKELNHGQHQAGVGQRVR